MNRKEHWNNIYSTKQPHEVSWTQELPKTSLEFIHGFQLAKTDKIIDIGGGDSRLVDYLIDEKFQDITVLDISEIAIQRAKKRLGEKAEKVKWIISDVLDFKPSITYDCWHDRAAFHFLTTKEEIDIYLTTARNSVLRYMVVGTFSDKGPNKCSMLDVHQYKEEELQQTLNKGFEKLKCITEDHYTPFNSTQNFLFCSFKRNGI